MSASKEKRNRVEQRSAGTDKKRNAASEETLSAQKFRRNAIIAVVCIVLVVAAAIVINSNLFYTELTAVRVGNTGYSAAEVDVFYRNTLNSVYNSYGSMASYIIDTSTPLTQQQYSEDQTWADYLSELTLENMKQVTALYDAAVANGFTLGETEESQIAEQMTAMDTTAVTNGARNTNQFLAAIYGKGVNTKVYESVLRRIVTAQSYGQKVSEELTYTRAESDAYYAEHKDELDIIRFCSYLVSTSDTAFENLDDDAKKAAAHEAAQTIAESGDAAAFQAAVTAYNETAISSEQAMQGGQLGTYYSEYSAWLLEDGRSSGDSTVIDSDIGSYAVLFLSRDDNNYATTSMRHILATTDTDGDGEYTEEEKAAALDRINDIQGQYLANPTEDNFAALATMYTDDTASAETGGLYENIARGQMVTGIDEFLFAPERTAGDTAVVYGQSSNYEGYHLVYFVGSGPLYKTYLAESAMRSADYSEWLENLIAGYETSSGAGRNYVKLS